MSLTRRNFLALAGYSVAASFVAHAARAEFLPVVMPGMAHPFPKDMAQSLETPLAKLASQRGILFGSALPDLGKLGSNYKQLIADHAAIVTPENDMKWLEVQQSPGRFEFAALDDVEGFCTRHQLKLRGHTLVWYKDAERRGWLKQRLTDAPSIQSVSYKAMPAAGDIMAQHINHIMGRYKGHLHSVDVVNEAIYCKDGRADGLRETAWMRLYGADYVKHAFELAASADPTATLVYNENQLEYQGSYYDKRRTALFKLLDRLQGSNTPIHAVGLQSHLKLGREFNPSQFTRFVNDLHKRGLQVMLTELDVRNVGNRMTMAELDQKAAAHMQSYLEAALLGAPIRTIQCWGLRDQVTTADQATGDEGSTRRLLPFDKDGNKRPVYAAIARALAQVPMA